MKLPESQQCGEECPKCGENMRNHGKREKHIITLLGECKFSRNYYECVSCENENTGNREHAVPNDEILGVAGTKFTETVKRVTAQIAASDSFFDTSANLKMLCGINVSAKE